MATLRSMTETAADLALFGIGMAGLLSVGVVVATVGLGFKGASYVATEGLVILDRARTPSL